MTQSREQAIRDLTRHCGDGRITLDELEERIEEVNRATTDDEIRHALRELPAVRHEPVTPPAPEREDTYAYSSYDDDERERIVPDDVLPPLPGGPCGPRLRHRGHEATGFEKTLRTVWVISGFIALFNGLWWLAIILWFVIPRLVLPNLRRI